jgi:hypothetical protein
VYRLSQACYMIRVIVPFLSQDVLNMIYYAYFHSLMIYGLLFWGNSLHSIEVCRLQKKILSIMMGARSRDYWRDFFSVLRILPSTSQYIYSTPCSMWIIKQYFTENSTLYDIKTINNENLFQPQSNLSIRRVLCMLASKYIKIFLFKWSYCQVSLIS